LTEGEGDSLKSELFSKTAFLYVSTFASAIFGYIALYFATRFIGSVNYGIVAFALSFVGIFTFVTDLGFGSAHTKKVSEGKDLQSCLSVFLLVRMFLIVIFVALVLGAMFVWEIVLGQGYEYPETHMIILIVLLYYIQISITSVFTSTFLAQRDVLRSQTITLFDVGSRAITTLVVVAFGFGLVGLACTYVAEGAISLAVALLLARKRLPRIRLAAIREPIFREYLGFAAPLALASIISPIAMYLDKVLIQYSTNAVETGIYYGSQSLLSFYLALGAIVSWMIYPAISEISIQRNGKEKILKITSSTLRYFLLLTMPIMLFLIIFSKEILSIFLSAAFEPGAIAFSILAIGYTMGLLMSPFGSQMLGMGMSKLYAKYALIAIAINIILDILLIPSNISVITLLGLGKDGAAISYLIRQIVLFSFFLISARKVIGFRAPAGIPNISAAAMAAVTLTYFLTGFMDISRFYDLVALFILNIGFFVCFAIAFRAIKKSEIRELLRLLRIKSLLQKPGI
jgi:O-antigen/teichoic acid export membrane protein